MLYYSCSVKDEKQNFLYHKTKYECILYTCMAVFQTHARLLKMFLRNFFIKSTMPW